MEALCSGERVVRLWDVASGQLRMATPEHSGTVFEVRLSRNGWLLAIACTPHAESHGNTDERTIQETLKDDKEPSFSSYSGNPTNDALVSTSFHLAGQSTVSFWNARNGRLLRKLDFKGSSAA